MTATLIRAEPVEAQATILAGEMMSMHEAQHRMARIKGALKILYSIGEKTGQRKLCAAALDAMSATRGLV